MTDYYDKYKDDKDFNRRQKQQESLLSKALDLFDIFDD